jgi:hypothetical protein
MKEEADVLYRRVLSIRLLYDSVALPKRWDEYAVKTRFT